MYYMLTVLPSFGIGALSAREAEGRANISAGDKEAHKLLQPVDKTLKTMAIEFAEYQVCVDVFITTQSYVDIASISVIPRTTGGQLVALHFKRGRQLEKAVIVLCKELQDCSYEAC
ncbi:unnamed protein product [Ilex paraguariensis]|uniref:Sec23/Sec24 trunk domain-containing protein n=1 Tax=Ilex paraguariensis TaxID=185542 RepID=A0ABC8UA65_9AQUA